MIKDEQIGIKRLVRRIEKAWFRAGSFMDVGAGLQEQRKEAEVQAVILSNNLISEYAGITKKLKIAESLIDVDLVSEYEDRCKDL